MPVPLARALAGEAESEKHGRFFRKPPSDVHGADQLRDALLNCSKR